MDVHSSLGGSRKAPLSEVETFAGRDPTTWAKLSSTLRWRRLQLLLLSEIVLELRRIRQALTANKTY